MLVRAVGASARPTRRDSHGGRSGGCPSRPCIARRHCAVDSNTYQPSSCQEAQGADAPFEGVGVYSMHKGEGTGGKPVSREETSLLSIRAPHLRPLIALSQQFRSCTETSVLLKTPAAYTRVRCQSQGTRGHCNCGWSEGHYGPHEVPGLIALRTPHMHRSTPRGLWHCRAIHNYEHSQQDSIQISLGFRSRCPWCVA